MIKENRATEEQALGQYQAFDTIQELIANLHEASVSCCPRCRLVFYPKSASDIHCGGNQ